MRSFCVIAANGKGIAEGRATNTDSGKKTALNKKLFPLTKLHKKMEAEKFFVDTAN